MSDNQNPGTSLDRFRRTGGLAKARTQEINAIFRSLETGHWGNVQGANLSEGSRYALARMCHVTQADPTLDIDILGGHPYHNANYYIRRAQNHERYVGHKYVNILDDADRRREYGVPEDVMAVYVVILTIYIPSAPLAAIRAGKIPFDEAMRWVTTVPGCNWAGNQRTAGSGKSYRDKVGMIEPDKTARTRAYRKAASNAFGTEFVDEQAVAQAEQLIEAEWDYADDTTTAADDEVIVGDGGVAEVVEGEVHEEEIDPEPMEPEKREPMPSEPEAPEPDIADLRRRYFATLRAVGIKDRKAFAADHDLPSSVTEWTADHFETAHAAIMDPLGKRVLGYCDTLGTTIEDESLRILDREVPEWASHWKTIETVLKGRIDDAENEQPNLL